MYKKIKMSENDKNEKNINSVSNKTMVQPNTSNLTDAVNRVLQSQVLTFAQNLVTKDSSLTVERIIEVWNECTGQHMVATVPVAAKPVTERKRTKSTPSGKTCPYKFAKGLKEGKECGAGVPNTCVDGTSTPRTFCNKHVKSEGKLTTTHAESKNVQVEKKTTTTTDSSAPTSLRRIKKDPVTGNLVHKETGLVFNTSSKVIGVQTDDGSLRNLTKADVQVVAAYGLNVDESAVISADEEDVELELELEA